MWTGARIWLKVILGFMFSMTTILTCLTFAFFGARTNDTVELIVTEATGMQNRVTVFSAQMQPLVIHNVFWLCLAALGFFLIFLYFIDHSFRVYLAPGVLCLVITLFLNIMLLIAQGILIDYTGGGAALFVMASITRVRQASLLVLVFGAFLIGLAHIGRNRQRPAG
ncbi:MAG: hypothetical protein AB1767_10335 [Bacillota bacterium]